MKKKQEYEWYKIRYMILAVTLLFTFIGVYNFSMEVSGGSADSFATDLEKNSKIFSMYVDDYFTEHISRLEDTALSLGDTALDNIKGTKKILKARQKDFASYTLLQPTGEKEFDNSDISMNFNLVKSEYLTTLISDKKTIIYNSTVQDGDRTKYVAFCTPVISNGEAVAILMGATPLTELDELMQRWEVTQEGCAFLMTQRGSYITSGERFYEIIGGEATDFAIYIENCSIRKGNPKATEIENLMKKEQSLTVRYSYSGDRYVISLLPEYNSGWYMAYLMPEKAFYTESFHLSVITIILLLISAILWLVVIVYGSMLIFKYGKSKEQLERFDTISRMDKAFIFEMNFSPKKLTFYGNLSNFVALDTKKLSGEGIYDIYDLIHPDDISVRNQLHHFFEDTQEIFTAEVRVRTDVDKYGWYRITATLIRDPYTRVNQKMIGKVESADEEIADEKNLMERAENDLLTGILNKKTMEERVTKSLETVSEGSGSYRIFFMVDLDNFKNVNDKLGHIVGDKAITDTADKLTEIFHRNAYVGRLGGDEFSVCVMYDAFDEESLYKYIIKKAEKVCEANRRTYTNGTDEVAISSSVGIAIAPDMATDFETLYKKADSALYKSKNGGKNCYHIYGK